MSGTHSDLAAKYSRGSKLVLPTSESHPLVPGEYPPRDTGQEVQLGVKAREKQVPCSGQERSRLEAEVLPVTCGRSALSLPGTL